MKMTASEKEFYEELRKTVWKPDQLKGDEHKRHYAKKLVMEILPEMLSSYKGSVLDLGCGESNKYPILKDRFDFVVGVDVSNAALKESKKVDAKNLIVVDATRLPFKDRSFDLVLSDQVLEHVKIPEKMLEEVKRVGKNFIITVPNEKLLSQRLINRIIGFDPSMIGHINKYSYSQWKLLIEKYLKIKSCRGLYLLNLLNLPSLRVLHKIFYLFEKKVNVPSFSFYLIFSGRCK
jgi:ubiquinone/menaquinone biosynthesis C-methylase UbiE